MAKKDEPQTTATDEQNARLEHSVDGATTRDDALDAGVPMIAGDPAEPQGPEDALGRGPKRGDYRTRVVGEPHEAVLTNEDDPYVRDSDGNIIDNKPVARLEAQAPRTEDIGDEKGKKGGVETA